MNFPPKIGLMPSRILARLLKGEEITHKDMWFEVASYRLAASICILRNKYGWQIDGKTECCITADPTIRAAQYTRYSLAPSIIDIAGEEGQAYIAAVQKWEATRKKKGMAATIPLSHIKAARKNNSRRQKNGK